MNSHNTHIAQETVNGESVFVPDAMAWEQLQQNPELDGISLGGSSVLKVIWMMLDFVTNHPNFSLGFFKPSPNYNRWLPTALYRLDECWQRVHVERIRCGTCGTEVQIANPMLGDLYPVEKQFDAMRQASKYPDLPCPHCVSKLRRYAIWLEQVS